METALKRIRMLRYTFLALFVVTLGWTSAVSCGGGDDTLCTPGENIFCKCRGGADGTKLCKQDGQSFEECVTEDGACTEIPETTSNTSGPHGATAASSTGSGTEKSALFTPCENADECNSGKCENHYCTLDCGNYLDCVDGDIHGDCVRFQHDTIQVCAPYCTAQGDCTGFGGESACGGATALDDPNFVFAVCGDWGDELHGMPLGTDCTGDPDCTLGLEHLEEVCIFQSCETGCFGPTDCPAGKTCSSDGSNPGTCS